MKTKWSIWVEWVITRVHRAWRTYQRLDALQDEMAGDVACEVLAQFGHQFGITFVLLS